MEPPKPADKQATLEASPALNAEEMFDEYQRLLSERFMQDPDAPATSPMLESVHTDREDRLKELYDELFPAGGRGSHA